MANTDMLKNQIMALVAQGRADEAWELAETVRDQLTSSELTELELWIAQNAYEAFRPPEDGQYGKAKWLQVAKYMDEGETLRDVLPKLPGELKEFLETEAKRATTAKLH